MQTNVAESVHLCAYPTADPSVIDEELSRRMAMVREIVSLGRSARMGAKSDETDDRKEKALLALQERLSAGVALVF